MMDFGGMRYAISGSPEILMNGMYANDSADDRPNARLSRHGHAVVAQQVGDDAALAVRRVLVLEVHAAGTWRMWSTVLPSASA